MPHEVRDLSSWANDLLLGSSVRGSSQRELSAGRGLPEASWEAKVEAGVGRVQVSMRHALFLVNDSAALR